VDVEAFPGQRARLYPRDNLSEKRVFASAARWDRAERAALADRLSRTPPPFHFVDAGANAGLYTLALRAVGQIRGLAIEPAPEMLARLRFNLRASGAGEVTVAPVALAAETGAVALAPAGANRGEVAVTGGGRGPHVAARPLLDVVREAGFGRIDALKIDIEGQEAEVLGAFLRDAPPSLRPGLVVIEAPRGADTPALALLRRTGYVTRERTRMNAILAAPRGGRPEPDKTGEAHGQA
jgi:FkbM family methyltransferase